MSKRILNVLFFITTFLVFTLISYNTSNASEFTAKVCPDNKVVVHYKKLNDNYDGVGLGTWGNGTGGSAAAINKSGVDDFGAVIEICVANDANLTGGYGFTPYNGGMPANGDDGNWLDDSYKDALNRMDINYDRAALASEDVIHVYYISGNDKVFYMDPTKPHYNKLPKVDGENTYTYGTITVMYFDPEYWKNANAYDGWEIHLWNTGNGGTGAPAPFQWDYVTADGGKLKVAVINVANDANTVQGIGFIVKNSSWEKKYSSDIFINPTDAVGSGDKVVYYVAGQGNVTTSYDEFLALYNLTKLNKFVDFDPIESTGTYASSVTEVKVSLLFPIEVSTANTQIVIKDAEENVVELSGIVAINETDGEAKDFTLTLTNELVKTATYTLTLGDDEVTTNLNLDNSAPMINYTNKVKLDTVLYNESTDTFLIEKGTTFVLENYLRLNVVDDRDGSLLDEVVITGTPDTSVEGNYTLKISATDGWNNLSEKEFKFQVYLIEVEEPVEEPVEDETFLEQYGLIIGIVAGLVVLSSAGVLVLKRKL
jgi:hypothetical protein